MTNLTARINDQVEIQFKIVRSIVNQIERDRLDIQKAIVKIDKEVEDLTLIKRALGESEEEQTITHKIIITTMVINFIKTGDIKQARYTIDHM